MYTGLFFNLKQGLGVGSGGPGSRRRGLGCGQRLLRAFGFLFIPCFERLVWLRGHRALAQVAVLKSRVAWAPHR